MSLAAAVTIDDVRAAAECLAGVVHRTPVATSRQTDERTRARVFFKCESFQRVGAFKIRGAYNALSRLNGEQRARGVLTYSSGNHAQATALAARLLGIRATIIMPTDAPKMKLAATRGYLEGTGGEVLLYDREETTREELGERLVAEHGYTLVPPFDHPHIIAGQGTTALEFFSQVERGEIAVGGGDPEEAVGGTLESLYVCCGGGGLLSGCATVARALAPGCRVVGVEPEKGDDAVRSFRTRELQVIPNPRTIADGARTSSLGRYTFPIVLERVDEMLAVSEGEIARAMLWVMERMKLVVEPTGALALAGLFKEAEAHPERCAGKRIGVVISGGNVDPSRIPDVLALA